jgi:hypothetical protein
MPRLAALVVLSLAFALTAPRAHAQERATRFEITEAQDTLFTFALGRHSWVAPGHSGIVVDPRRRDVLVARFRVLTVQEGFATAVVTGQTTTLSTSHAALIDEPRKTLWRRGAFWAGILLGLGLGFLGGVAAT